MQNWSSTENEAMKGYIILATRYLNDEWALEGCPGEEIDKLTLWHLLQKLNRATDDLTPDEARSYFLHSNLD